MHSINNQSYRSSEEKKVASQKGKLQEFSEKTEVEMKHRW